MHKQKVTKLYSENNIRLKVTQMECIDNHKIDYNGGGGGRGFPVASGIYTANLTQVSFLKISHNIVCGNQIRTFFHLENQRENTRN